MIRPLFPPFQVSCIPHKQSFLQSSQPLGNNYKDFFPFSFSISFSPSLFSYRTHRLLKASTSFYFHLNHFYRKPFKPLQAQAVGVTASMALLAGYSMKELATAPVQINSIPTIENDSKAAGVIFGSVIFLL